jgi:hypothetical protein
LSTMKGRNSSTTPSHHHDILPQSIEISDWIEASETVSQNKIFPSLDCFSQVFCHNSGISH